MTYKNNHEELLHIHYVNYIIDYCLMDNLLVTDDYKLLKINYFILNHLDN